MVAITLPDGSERQFDGPVTGAQVAADIGPGLAKAALAVRVDGEVRDLSRLIEADSQLAIITAKDDDGLELLRHDAAHVLAEAAKELYPDIQVTIGPAIENGFYYDFATPTRKSSARSGTGMKRSPFSRGSARLTRPKLSATFPNPKKLPFTVRAISSTCAAGRTCPAPANWANRLN